MQVETTLEKMPKHVKSSVDTIVEDMNRKLALKKKPLITAEDLSWSYTWGQRINVNCDLYKSLSLSLLGTLGRRKSYGRLQINSNEDLPEEVMEVYYPKVPPETVNETNVPNIATLSYLEDDNSVVNNYVTGGYYEKRTGENILCVAQHGDVLDEYINVLFSVNEQHAKFGFFPKKRFTDKLMAQDEGADFTYNNERYKKLTTEQVIKLCEGKKRKVW